MLQQRCIDKKIQTTVNGVNQKQTQKFANLACTVDVVKDDRHEVVFMKDIVASNSNWQNSNNNTNNNNKRKEEKYQQN